MPIRDESTLHALRRLCVVVAGASGRVGKAHVPALLQEGLRARRDLAWRVMSVTGLRRGRGKLLRRTERTRGPIDFGKQARHCLAMPVELTITELTDRFPAFGAALLVFRGLSIPSARDEDLAADIAAREAACRERHGGTELSAIPGVAAWRSAYKGFGIRKTSYRSSVERLIKRVLAGESLPAINAFVDAYNAVSLSHGLCVGADDLDKIAPPLAFRYARPGDSFLDMATAPGEAPDDPPKPGEVVLADSRHVLCRRWNWRQDARSAIGPGTTAAVVTIQANGWGDLGSAVADLSALVAASCGGTVSIAFVDAGRPTAALT